MKHPERCTTGDGLLHPPNEEETQCGSMVSFREAQESGSTFPTHCECWYDGDGCCRCGDPALPYCPVCVIEGLHPGIDPWAGMSTPMGRAWHHWNRQRAEVGAA